MNKTGQRLKLGQSQSGMLRKDMIYSPLALDEETLIKRQRSFEESMQLNVKEHIEKCEDALAQLKEELKQSKKDLTFLRDELQRIRDECFQTDDGISKHVCEEVNRLQNELRKEAKSDMNQLNSFTVQIYQLRVDKEEIEENYRLSELRMQSCENDVGFKRVYD